MEGLTATAAAMLNLQVPGQGDTSTLDVETLLKAIEAWESSVQELKALLATHEGSATTHRTRFLREGEYWDLNWGGRTTRLRDRKGLRYIAALIESADREIHVLDLVAAERGHGASGTELARATGWDEGAPVLDAQAKRSYRHRLQELREQLDEAESHHDLGRAGKARSEMEILEEELGRAMGLGGRDRFMNSSVERARTSVTRSIRTALKAIEKQDPIIGRHLASAIRTGRRCSYSSGTGYLTRAA